jgi:hypothetical protein
MNNAPLLESFEDNMQPHIDNSVKRVKDYLSAVDREFNSNIQK